MPQRKRYCAMNSPLVVEQARNLVKRDDFQETAGADARIRLLYDLIYQREPTDVEIELGLNFLKETPPARNCLILRRRNLNRQPGSGMGVRAAAEVKGRTSDVARQNIPPCRFDARVKPGSNMLCPLP